MGKINFYNTDCMEFMSTITDNYYDLAIVDPPYGIGISSNPVRQKHNKKDWDKAIPDTKYFKELQRISKNQIVFGGNYFPLHPSQGFIIWDKMQPENFSLAMCEFAWTSIQKPAKMFRYSVLNEKNKIHPTQKPVQLYKWILRNYAKPGMKIIDTHGGSMNIAIAADDIDIELDITEIDTEYFKTATHQYYEYKRQLKLF